MSLFPCKPAFKQGMMEHRETTDLNGYLALWVELALCLPVKLCFKKHQKQKSLR
jgi:hypothetical protein